MGGEVHRGPFSYGGSPCDLGKIKVPGSRDFFKASCEIQENFCT